MSVHFHIKHRNARAVWSLWLWYGCQKRWPEYCWSPGNFANTCRFSICPVPASLLKHFYKNVYFKLLMLNVLYRKERHKPKSYKKKTKTSHWGRKNNPQCNEAWTHTLPQSLWLDELADAIFAFFLLSFSFSPARTTSLASFRHSGQYLHAKRT